MSNPAQMAPPRISNCEATTNALPTLLRINNIIAAVPYSKRYEVRHAAENMPKFDADSRVRKTRSAAAFVVRLR